MNHDDTKGPPRSSARRRASVGFAGWRIRRRGKLSDEQIARLIGQLGSDQFSVREEASRRLQAADEALEALRRAAQSPDAEVRRRAGEILAALEERQAQRLLRESVAGVNEEGIDLFIDRMVLQKGYATDTRWKAALELARALARRVAQEKAAAPAVPELDVLSLPEATSCTPVGPNAARVRVEGVDHIINVHRSLFFSSGPLRGINSTDHSVLFVNGDIELLNSTTNSVLICNGTIKSLNSTRNCLIYCNGVIGSMNSTRDNAVLVRDELRQMNGTVGNLIEAGKLLRGNLSQRNTYRNCKPAGLNGPGQGDRFVTGEESLLSFFRTYEPARAGLEFGMTDGDARVEKVRDGTAFAKAGLRKGDRIPAVGRDKFLSEDTFVRLLRRGVLTGRAVLKVQRGERVVEVHVRFEP